MKVEIEVDVPDGFEFVGYRQVELGEYYRDFTGKLHCWPSGGKSNHLHFVFHKIERPRPVTEDDIGKTVTHKELGVCQLLAVWGDYAWVHFPAKGKPTTTKVQNLTIKE